MPVVLISRGTMTGGQALARCLADRLSLAHVTREDLVAAVDARGEHAQKVVHSIERASRNYDQFSQLRRPYLVFMRLALLEFVGRENVVYAGSGGHLLIPRLPCCLRVRVNAPMEFRVRNARERLNLSEGDALAAVLREDEERVRWARFMYGRDVRDPDLYDICVSLERMSVPAICAMLAATLAEQEFRPTPASRESVANLYLASQVEAALVSDPRTAPWEIGAQARRGEVLLQGPYLEDAQLATVLEVARSVAGVEVADYQPGYAPSFEFAT